MTQEIYWELLAWLFRSFLAVTAFAFVVAGYQALRCRPRCGNGQGRRRIREEGMSFHGGSRAGAPGKLTSPPASRIFRECPAVCRIKPPCPP